MGASVKDGWTSCVPTVNNKPFILVLSWNAFFILYAVVLILAPQVGRKLIVSFRSVSYPTPTYYAHLVADRARKHHNELAMADNSSCSGNSKGDLSEKEKLDIKKRVEEGICKAMYFV